MPSVKYKIKEAKWKEFCTNAAKLGFEKIAPGVYGSEGNASLVRVDQRGICLVTHTKQAEKLFLANEDYKFENGFPESVIRLIEAGFVQLPEFGK